METPEKVAALSGTLATLDQSGRDERILYEIESILFEPGSEQMDKTLERNIRKFLRLFNIEISRTWYPINIWDNDEEFLRIYGEMWDHTSVGDARCFMIYQVAKHVESLDGEAAEVGVYRGGTAKLAAKAFKKAGKVVHLFDTFSGMPDTVSNMDLVRPGEFSKTSLEAVQKFLSDCDNVIFHEGMFPETAKPVENAAFCFAHIDVDIYKSVLDCLAFFYPRMTRGGVMLFDDYEWARCPGVKRAITEFLSDKKESPIVTTKYQCAIIKL